jgi:aarF domain-containing kinase
VDHTTGTIRDVVVKVQYPGVARSIESDLNNLAMLVKLTGLAPKGLFIDNVIRVGQKELQVECDYQREKENQMRIQALVRADPVLVENRFVVPDVIEDLTTEQVITRYVSLHFALACICICCKFAPLIGSIGSGSLQ